jgi:putative sterol carrier protein
MPKVSSPQDVFDAIPGMVDPDTVKGLNAQIQFDLSGEAGGQWVVSVADGQVTTARGAAPNPNVTATLSAADFVLMVNGEMKPMNAFMTGKLKIKGDMALVMKLQGLFGRR